MQPVLCLLIVGRLRTVGTRCCYHRGYTFALVLHGAVPGSMALGADATGTQSLCCFCEESIR